MPYEKVGKNEPVCISDEVPFDIPESWEWVRLANICTKLVDGDHNPPKGESIQTSFIMASSTNINNDTLVDLEKVRFLSETVFIKENERTQASVGDIFFTSVGSLGRSCVYQGGLNICFQRSVSVITTLVYNYYLKYIFDSGYVQQKVFAEATGTAQKGFYLNQMAKLIVPVPPLSEQYRIVEEIRRILPLLTEYSKKEIEISALQSSFPDQLKKSILQEAVQGKLVPQDPNDEPASVLLERIRAEKQHLVQEGKIKKDKHESVIFRRDNSHYEIIDGEERCIDAEIPFEIPDTWEWIRLNELCKKIGAGSTPSGGKAVYVSEGIKFIRSQNVYNDGLRLSDIAHITEDTNLKKVGSIVQAKDILLNITGGSIGRCAIVPDDFDIANINQHVMIIRLVAPIMRQWIHSILISDYIQTLIMDVQVGVSREGLSAKKLMNFLIPIPPVLEQRRIVEKQKELFDMINLL